MKNDIDDKNAMPINPVVHYALQLVAIFLLLIWCFKIIEPFIIPLVWAAVLATTLYPAHQFLTKKLGNRNAISAIIISALMLMTIIGPAVWLILSTVDEVRTVGQAYQQGHLNIPPPAESVKTWPVIGQTTYQLWNEASSNITAFITNHKEQATTVAMKFFGLLTNTGKGILIFALSIIIGGFLLGFARPAGKFMNLLLYRIAGEFGEDMLDSASKTVRNVAKGVLGVAIIQSILAGIAFVAAGIPLAGVWILVCLILCIVQIGLLPVSVGSIIYIWSAAPTGTAIAFTAWMVFVGVVDNVLKPLLMGKGAPAPMLVVFLGAIGGFMFSGFIGLFTGAIVLTLGYNLLIVWVNNPSGEKNEQPPDNKEPVPELELKERAGN